MKAKLYPAKNQSKVKSIATCFNILTIVRVGHGEGLFLKRHVKEKIIVAFYNGLRLPGLEPEDADWEDRGYR